MRSVTLSLVVCVVGCGSVNTTPDAREIDAAVDAPPSCTPTTLLAGGSDIAAQGWSTTMQAPATLTNGPDYVRLATSTVAGATSGGQLLINYPGALETGKPFKLQVVMLVESVSMHNSFDSGAAILGSFVPPFGVGADREQMIYLDAGAIGWADDTQTYAVNVANNAYHTYELSVDASNVARVTIDGVAALMRTGYTFNGAIAIGDQTNDANVDGVVRIRSVTKLCL